MKRGEDIKLKIYEEVKRAEKRINSIIFQKQKPILVKIKGGDYEYTGFVWSVRLLIAIAVGDEKRKTDEVYLTKNTQIRLV